MVIFTLAVDCFDKGLGVAKAVIDKRGALRVGCSIFVDDGGRE